MLACGTRDNDLPLTHLRDSRCVLLPSPTKKREQVIPTRYCAETPGDGESVASVEHWPGFRPDLLASSKQCCPPAYVGFANVDMSIDVDEGKLVDHIANLRRYCEQSQRCGPVFHSMDFLLR